jgi:DNA-binding NarL/FixJ family response regulator
MNHKPKILIVDDEEGPRESLKIILKPEFEVVTLGRGSEAVEMLRDGGFELILLDITMPEDLSGIDTLQAIRAAAIDVEAIVISGQAATDPIMACVNLGAYRYIKKPYRADEVVSAVRAAIATRNARQRAQAMRERLLGSLSHELRTPLNAIVGYTEILHEETRDLLGDEHRHALARIQHSSERLLAYWESLFFLGELDSGSVSPKPRELAVRPWLERLVRRIARSGDGGPTLTLTCPEDLVGFTHPETLARLLAVLVYEATDDDGVAIDVAAWIGDGMLCVAIEHDASTDERLSADQGEVEAAATELAREVVARASEVLGASVARQGAGNGRVRVLITLPHDRPAAGTATGARGAASFSASASGRSPSSPSRSSSSRSSSGTLAAAHR